MGTAAGMIEQARLLLGTGEHPPGSNHNQLTDWYGVGNTPWCDIAISFEAGHSDNLAAIGWKFAWTVAHANSFRDRGRWITMAVVDRSTVHRGSL